MMLNKYIKYLPWMILGTLSSYLLATPKKDKQA